MERLLYTIDSPKKLRDLKREDLVRISNELRDEILEQVSKTGGHLAASLGTVELTVALHYVFNTPTDKILWDIGHQAYGHKLLTGRRENFHTLRKKGGISGFLKRDESEYDTIGAGHASTSIGQALGIKAAFEHSQNPSQVVAIIGDGGLTGGVAFEGLNHTGDLQKNLTVVLNDNDMSISPNVGALSKLLNKRVLSNLYPKIKSDLKDLLEYLSAGPVDLLGSAKKIRQSLKTLLTPGSLFEELGFRYIGPIDGHDVLSLVDTFTGMLQASQNTPTLVHIITKKGFGYEIAEKAPLSFHGVNTFNLKDGKPLKKPAPAPPSYTSVFSDTLIKLAEQNEKIVAITAAMPTGTGLVKFQEKFPDRFYDVGIAEQHAVLFSAGLAMEGMRPIATIYSTFLQRAYDQLIHDVGIQNIPVIFALDRAGLVGADGPTHHGAYDLSYLRLIPNYTIMAPKDENELQHMLNTAVNYVDGPIVVRYPRGNGYGVPLDQMYKEIPIGKAEVIYPAHSEFNFEDYELAILAIGTTVYPSMQVAKQLYSEGRSVLVVNARFAKPLDEELILKIASEIPMVVTAEENTLMGGFGSAVLECFEKHDTFPKAIKRLGIPDTFIHHATQQEQREECGISYKNIYKVVSGLLSTKVEGYTVNKCLSNSYTQQTTI